MTSLRKRGVTRARTSSVYSRRARSLRALASRGANLFSRRESRAARDGARRFTFVRVIARFLDAYVESINALLTPEGIITLAPRASTRASPTDG